MITRDECLGMLDDIDNHGSGLTDWEIEFTDSLMKQLEAGKDPSDKQCATVKRIHKERVK